MVQLSTPWGDLEPGNVRRFLSNYFDLLFILMKMVSEGVLKLYKNA